MAKPFKGRAPNFQAFWWPFEATLPPFDIHKSLLDSYLSKSQVM